MCSTKKWRQFDTYLSVFTSHAAVAGVERQSTHQPDTQQSFEGLPRATVRATGPECGKGTAQQPINHNNTDYRTQRPGNARHTLVPAVKVLSPLKAATHHAAVSKAVHRGNGEARLLEKAGDAALSPAKLRGAKSHRRSLGEKKREARGAVLPQRAAAQLAQARVYHASEDDPFRCAYMRVSDTLLNEFKFKFKFKCMLLNPRIGDAFPCRCVN